jgi:hypothetical protein
VGITIRLDAFVSGLLLKTIPEESPSTLAEFKKGNHFNRSGRRIPKPDLMVQDLGRASVLDCGPEAAAFQQRFSRGSLISRLK